MTRWLKHADALPPLTRLAVDDPDASVRRAAAGALGYAAEGVDGTAVLDALRGALADADWTVREEAATTLGKLRWAVALPLLIEALDDSNWQVRQRTARAVGRLGPAAATALPAMLALLGHAIANVRKEVVIALGEIGHRDARPALEQAAHDADPDVRKLARLAITQIGAAEPAAR